MVSTAPLAPLLPLPTLRSHTVELPAVPASVRAARGAAGEALTSWGVAEALHDSVVLVVSELMTNAVTHSGSERIVCRVHGTAGLIRVEIEDQDRGRRRPEPRQPGPEEPSGRGLLLVGTVSRDWGVTPAPHGGPGRVVWAELTAETDTGTADDETGASHESGGEESGAVRLADPSWTAGRPRPGTGHPHARTPRPHGPRCPNTMP